MAWNENFWNSGRCWNQGAAHRNKKTANTNKNMAGNPLPERRSRLRALGKDMADGLDTHEVTVGVKQCTAVVIRAALAAEETAQNQFTTAAAARDTANENLQIADSNAKALIGSARVVLAKRYGTRWNAQWVATGFPDQSTAVPTTQDARYDLCESLKNYFTANPTHENAGMGVTAALAEQQHEALKAARKGVKDAATAAGQKRRARDAAQENLRTRMRGLIDELAGLLPDDDPRWHAFGLSMPSDPSAPEKVTGLILSDSGPGLLYLDWPDIRRADRYHVLLQIVGTDTEPRRVDTVEDSDATLKGLTTGATARIQVVAVNTDGETGLPSDVLEVVVP